MAKSLRRCVGVDLGSSAVKVADLSLTKTGVTVNQLASVDLEFPANMPEAEREAATAKALRALLKQHKIASRGAVFAVPGQHVFVRRLRLPRTNEERMRRIINYEADQLIPFPPDQSLRRYQIIDIPGEEEAEVLLTAIKREHVEHYMRLIGRTGLKPLAISVGPLALHNFHRFLATPFVSPEERKARLKEEKRRQAEAAAEAAEAAAEAAADGSKKKRKKKKPAKEQAGGKEGKSKGFSLAGLFSKKSKAAEASGAPAEAEGGAEPADEALEAEPAEAEFQEIVASVNVGARTMDLAVPKIEGGSTLGFTRSVPLAGNEMTAAIQREKNLADFAAAEKLKRERTMVLRPGADVPPGIDVEASKALTKVVDRLLVELRRSLDFFISQPDGVVVDAIALSGGAAAVPQLAEYMEDRLGVPVRGVPDAPPAQLTLSEGAVNASKDALAPYLVAIGLGVFGLEYGEIAIDFLPEELQVLRAMKRKAPLIFIMAASIAASIALSTQIGAKAIGAYRDAIANMGPILAQDKGRQIDALVEARRQIDGQFTALGRAFAAVDNEFWFRFMAFLHTAKPKDVVISMLELGDTGVVQIRGFAEVDGSPALLVRTLKDDTALVRDSRLFGTMPLPSHPLFPGRVTMFQVGVILNRVTRMATPPPGFATQPEGAATTTEAPPPEAGAEGAAPPAFFRPPATGLR